MQDNTVSIREIIVLMSAIIYWGGVAVNAYRVRKRIGHSPNIKPKDLKERLLWIGWFSVIAGWFIQPLILSEFRGCSLFSFMPVLFNNYGLFLGIILAAAGYAGTLKCYSAMGDSWRIGINENESTSLVKHGPYRFIRHPIYSFQILILIGTALLLPTLFSIIILLVHYVCVLIKALDEEKYLLGRTGSEYSNYYSKTGRFIPKLK